MGAPSQAARQQPVDAACAIPAAEPTVRRTAERAAEHDAAQRQRRRAGSRFVGGGTTDSARRLHGRRLEAAARVRPRERDSARDAGLLINVIFVLVFRIIFKAKLELTPRNGHVVAGRRRGTANLVAAITGSSSSSSGCLADGSGAVRRRRRRRRCRSLQPAPSQSITIDRSSNGRPRILRRPRGQSHPPSRPHSAPPVLHPETKRTASWRRIRHCTSERSSQPAIRPSFHPASHPSVHPSIRPSLSSVLVLVLVLLLPPPRSTDTVRIPITIPRLLRLRLSLS